MAVLLMPMLGFAATIHVPGDYATIQAGIDAAVTGDTVLVSPGTYQENIIFKGKEITVKSSQGPQMTVIDGNQITHVVMFNQNEDPDTVLEGFTLTNGNHSKGAGIYCKDSASPSIIGNVIIGNQAGEGGGIFCIHAEPVIMGNLIAMNTATAGGAIYSDNAEPLILNNIIRDNTTTASGAGVYCFSCSPDMVNNTFVGNTAGSGRGGAVAGNNFQSTIVNSILWGNSAPDGPEIGLGALDNPSVLYCDVKGGWSGTGNIDADPLFVDTAGGDLHLTYLSPCKDAGDNTVVTMTVDLEGDPRIANGAVDMGADEFYTHLYWTGDAAPGGAGAFKFVGIPGTAPVQLWLGSGVMDPPMQTKYGAWYLQFPLLANVALGAIPASGVLALPFALPPDTPTPLLLPFQAGIGKELTNLSLMNIE
jgi:hypothetical protein